MDYLFIMVGFGILILGGNWLLKAAVSLSLRLDVPKIIIGMTVVSFATSAPELIVSLKSAIEDHPDIALGNVIGSNIANLGFVLGIVIVVGTIQVERSFYITDWPVMMLASVMLYLFLAIDGELQRWEGLVMFVTLLLVLIYLLKFQKVAVIDDLNCNGFMAEAWPKGTVTGAVHRAFQHNQSDSNGRFHWTLKYK